MSSSSTNVYLDATYNLKPNTGRRPPRYVTLKSHYDISFLQTAMLDIIQQSINSMIWAASDPLAKDEAGIRTAIDEYLPTTERDPTTGHETTFEFPTTINIEPDKPQAST